MARTLQPAATLPTADELTQLWLNHLTMDSKIHYQADFEQFAGIFLERLNFHLENQQPLQWIVQARRQRSNEEATQRMADAAEQSAAGVEALQEKLRNLTVALETLLQANGSSSVYTDGGAYIGGDVWAQNFAGRDLTIKNYFVQGLAQLPIDYSVRIENFLHTYLGGHDEQVPFGGRSQQLDELNDWLDDPTAPPYYLMVAEAGKGKSALVSRWSAQLTTRPDLKVIFVPISIRFQTAAQDVFFAALAGRLAQIYETTSPESFHKPTSAEEWKAICESYLRRPLPEGQRLVVILDGLDEATDWTAGPELFAVRPPTGLRVLVTARLRARETDALGWAATLQWEGPQLARKTTLPALDQQGVADALHSMGNPLPWLTPQMDVVGKLYQLSQGDPLLVQLYVRELVKAQQRTGFLAPTDLNTLEPGLDGFMQKWWEDQRKQWRMQGKDPNVEEEQLLPLLCACAIAVGPLLLSDLAALDETRFGVTRIVANQAELLGRWLIGDGVRQGYIFAHPRLREFFAGPSWLSADEYTAWQAKFCEWGKRVLIDLKRGHLRSQAAPEYLLRHYATHLTQSGAAPQRFYALISDGWRRAWEAVDVSYGGFLKDVDRAWAQARQAYGPQRPGRGEALAQQVRAALCRSSVATLASNLPPELLAELVKRGLRTSTEAMAIIKLMPKAEQRVLALTVVAPHLAAEVLDEALAVARASECEYEQHNRVAALCAIAIRLPEPKKTEVLGDALVAAYAIQYFWSEKDSAIALHTLVPHLPPQLLADTLAKLRESEYMKGSVGEFSAFVKYLSDQELKRMLEDIFDSYSWEFAKNPQIPVTRLFVEALPAELIEDAVEAANKQNFLPYRVRALNALMPYLSEEQRRQVIEKMFVLAFVTRVPPYAADYVALATLAQWLSESEQKVLLERAWRAWNPRLSEYREVLKDPLAAGLCDRPTEAYAVIECALYLPPETCKTALAYYRQNTWENGNVLRALAPRLSAQLVQETFIEACEFKERVTIGALCPYLPTDFPIELLEVALKSCRIIEDGHRIDVLIKLVAYLPKNLRARVINVINPNRKSLFLATYLSAAEFRVVVDEAIADNDWGLKELIARVPNLPDNELRIILRKIEALFDDTSGTCADSINLSMLAVLSYLPTNEQREMLKQAITDVRTNSTHQLHRADPLIVLTPFLTGRKQQEVIREAFAEIYSYSSIHYSHMWACLSRLSALSPYLPSTMIREVLLFVEGFESQRGQTVGLGILAQHFPNHERNTFLAKAMSILCKTDESTGEFRLRHLEPHLTRWAIEQPEPAHAALAENLPILATKPRDEFMYDLAALMPFILALAGDEAPQASEGIYHAIQEVCVWWP
ncbi:MAG: ATP-binding protein [Caldilineaceae bacterium]